MTLRSKYYFWQYAVLTVLAVALLSFTSVSHALAKTDAAHAHTAINTTLTVTPRRAADRAAERLAVTYPPGTDLQPTGLYLPPDRNLSVRVELRGAAEGTPSIAVGAPSANLDPEATEDTDWWRRTLDTRTTALREGENFVTDPHGGPIYISWPSKRRYPTGEATLTLGAGTRKMATFTLGQTTPQAFRRLLEQRPAPFVELYSERTVLTLYRTQALKFRNENQTALMATLERIIRTEDRLAGYDSGGPQSVGPAGPHHLVGYPGGLSGIGAFAQSYATVYPEPIHDYLLDVHGLRTGGWGIYHELGHQHQMEAVTPSDLGEVSVNIYSLAVQRAFTRAYRQVPRLRAVNPGGTSYWDDAITALGAGIDTFADLEVFVRLIPFEQLRLAYGEEMLTSWHEIVRRQKFPTGADTGATDELRWQNVVLSTSMAAEADLSGFWADWGVSVEQKTIDAIVKLKLKPPTQDLTRLREPNVSGSDVH